MKRRWLSTPALLGTLLLGPLMHAGMYAQTEERQAVTGTGAVHGTDGYRILNGTVGQGIIGSIAGEHEAMGQGFWYAPRSSDITSVAGNLPPETSLSTLSAFPNPFTSSTRIALHIPHTDRVSLILYDLLGHPLHTLIDGEEREGPIDIDLSAHDLPSGQYTLVLQTGNSRQELTLVIVK